LWAQHTGYHKVKTLHKRKGKRSFQQWNTPLPSPHSHR
jgi:hypothetical protein